MLCPKYDTVPCSTWVDQSVTKKVPVGRSTHVIHGSTGQIEIIDPGRASCFKRVDPNSKKNYNFKSKKINKKFFLYTCTPNIDCNKL